VNTLAQVRPGASRTCEQLLVTLHQAATGVIDLRLKVNGAALDRPERFLLETGCFTLRDATSGQTGPAVGNGYWVFIRPLPKGRHELEFGAAFTTHDFRQNITYVLHVR